MADIAIRAGCAADIGRLLDIERSAAALLLEHGAHDLFAMHSLSADDLQRGIDSRMLTVAEVGSQAVGFALCGEVDGQAYLFEMDVLPEVGRRGIGSALLESVCAQAGARGCATISLVTLRNVPWNAPFYAARGFYELPISRHGPQLAQLIAHEQMLGFPMQLRVVMQRGVQSAAPLPTAP
ncbi:MAG: GNAT family N-acetyltransferase [Pseudoxanthomonas sp.]|nr:GNAT family N-acetyltransferase [Pseudoxanthomonas sp.]